MKITAERFKALLDGTATDVSGEERLIRVEAFSAERRGEDPASAVQTRMPNVSIVEASPVAIPLGLPETNTRSSAASPIWLPLSMTTSQKSAVKHCLWWLAFMGIAVAMVWFAASVGMGSLVAHFIGLAIFGLCMQGILWFFRAPVNRS